jgi:hypothetical protein
VEWKSWPLPARLNNIYSQPPLPRGLLYYLLLLLPDCFTFFFSLTAAAGLSCLLLTTGGGTQAQHSIDGGHQPCVSPDQTRSVLCAACFNAIGGGWARLELTGRRPRNSPTHHHHLQSSAPLTHWEFIIFQTQSCSILCAGKRDIIRRGRHV